MEIAAEVFGQPRSHVTNSTSFFRQRTENIQFNVFAKPTLTHMFLRSKCSISCSGKQGLTAASTRPPIKLAAGYADLVRQPKIRRHTKRDNLPERSTDPLQIYPIG